MSAGKPSGSGDHRPDQAPRPEHKPFPGQPDSRLPVPPPTGTKTADELRADRAKYKTTSEYTTAKNAEKAAAQEAAAEETPAAAKEPAAARPGAGTAPERGTSHTPPDKHNTHHPERTRLTPDQRTRHERELVDKDARISRLETDLGKSNEDRGKLIAVVARQDGRIDRLETENGQLKAEIERLKAEKDRPAEQGQQPGGKQPPERGHPGESAAATSPYRISEQTQQIRHNKSEHTRLHLPSGEAVLFGAAVSGAAETVAANTHHLSGPAQGLIVSFVGVGVTGLAWFRKHQEKRDENGH